MMIKLRFPAFAGMTQGKFVTPAEAGVQWFFTALIPGYRLSPV
jgi:hypothetical protein